MALAVSEFVRAGFARVGILRGGFNALDAAQLEALVVDDAVRSGGAAAGSGSSSGVTKLKEEASAKLGQAKEALRSKLSFSRRPRAKPAPM